MEETSTKLNPGEEQTTLPLLEKEHDNLRAALEWRLARQETELAGRLAGALWRFWYMHGYLSEGREWLNSVLALSSGQWSEVSDQSRPGALALAPLAGHCPLLPRKATGT